MIICKKTINLCPFFFLLLLLLSVVALASEISLGRNKVIKGSDAVISKNDRETLPADSVNSVISYHGKQISKEIEQINSIDNSVQDLKAIQYIILAICSFLLIALLYIIFFKLRVRDEQASSTKRLSVRIEELQIAINNYINLSHKDLAQLSGQIDYLIEISKQQLSLPKQSGATAVPETTNDKSKIIIKSVPVEGLPDDPSSMQIRANKDAEFFYIKKMPEGWRMYVTDVVLKKSPNEWYEKILKRFFVIERTSDHPNRFNLIEPAIVDWNEETQTGYIKHGLIEVK